MPNFGWDYPPGVSESMIPGCNAEDEKMNDVCDRVEEMSDLDVVEKLEESLPTKAFERLMQPLRDALVDWMVSNPPEPEEPEFDNESEL